MEIALNKVFVASDQGQVKVSNCHCKQAQSNNQYIGHLKG